MLFLVIRKIIKNKWLSLSLFIGMLLTVAMVCAIPLFTNGILQRMLKKDLESFQNKRHIYPGRYEINLDLYTNYSFRDSQQYKTYNFFEDKIDNQFINDIGINSTAKRHELEMSYLYYTPEEYYGLEEAERLISPMVGLEGLKEHSTIVSGRYPSAEVVDGVIECALLPQFQRENDVLLDHVYILEDYTDKNSEVIKIKPVGIITVKDENDPWWINIDNYYDAFLIDYDYMKSKFLYETEQITKAKWLYQLDYSQIEIEDLNSFVAAIASQDEWFNEYSGIRLEFKALDIFNQYLVRAKQLRLTLWVLQAPILIMLAFYLFMAAQLVIENDKNEISILKSRGFSRWQIFAVYLLQSSLLAFVACLVGPIVGILICKVLGASNGFLEFVSRTKLPVKMTKDAIVYSCVSGLFSIGVMIIPAIKASKVSIVEQKQIKSRKWKSPWWQKTFLDIILLSTSIYGLNSYLRQGEARFAMEQTGLESPIDPFMFLILTLFILGAGLMFLRIYPLLIKMIYKIGKKHWSPVMYSSLVQVSRSTGREQFLILFLILTVSVGIFSANSVRTINKNIEDRIYYDIGCDIKMQVEWNSSAIVGGTDMVSPEAATISTAQETVVYIEPPFSAVENISGIESAAKVLREDEIIVKTKSDTIQTELMAIEPYSFGNVVWSSNNILPHHINEYLNLMTYSLNYVIVSEAYRQELGLETGDSITYYWAGQSHIEGVIVAFAEFWPGINPLESNESKYFVVSNLRYVQVQTATQPYEVWMKTSGDSSTAQIYNSIAENNINLKWIKTAKQEIISKKNDPFIQGINGAMTLGFIVTMMISIIGYIIYWVLSIKARILQFGIFRAMGMTKKNVFAIIAIEQLLISLTAIITGVIIGGISCSLFMPLLEVIGSASEQVPPFRLIADRSDYIKIYTLLTIMMAGGISFIGTVVSKIKVAQVIKLGED